MVNRRRKGRKLELDVEDILKKEGWFTDTARGSTRFAKKVDIWGIFDIVGIRKLDGVTQHLYAQCKCNRKPVETPYREFKDKYCDKNCFVHIYIKKDRRGITKLEL